CSISFLVRFSGGPSFIIRGRTGRVLFWTSRGTTAVTEELRGILLLCLRFFHWLVLCRFTFSQIFLGIIGTLLATCGTSLLFVPTWTSCIVTLLRYYIGIFFASICKCSVATLTTLFVLHVFFYNFVDMKITGFLKKPLSRKAKKKIPFKSNRLISIVM